MKRFTFAFCTGASFAEIALAIPIAKELNTNGHSVVFITSEKQKKLVLEQGFLFESFFPDRFPKLRKEPKTMTMSTFFFLLTRFKQLIKRYQYDLVNDYNQSLEILSKYSPKMVYIGGAAHYFLPIVLAAEKLGIPWATGFRYPQFNVEAEYYFHGFPVPTTSYEKIRFKLLSFLLMSPLLSFMRTSLNYIIEKTFPSSKIRWSEIQCSPYLHLIQTAQEFDFPRRLLLPQMHYIGPCLFDKPLAGLSPPDWVQKLPLDLPLIFVGTSTTGMTLEKVKIFLGTVIEAFYGLNCSVIFASPALAAEQNIALPSQNFHAASFIPITSLIHKIDCIIHMGGVGNYTLCPYRGSSTNYYTTLG